MIVFAPQNVIKDPPFTKLDILSCRNLMIYMEPVLQKRLLNLFNYSINPGSILLLGTAENPGSKTEGFIEIDSKLKIYTRSELASSSQIIDIPSSFYRNKNMKSEKTKKIKIVENIQTVTDQIIIQDYAPASVLVNNTGDILYITGQNGKKFEPTAEQQNWKLNAMCQ